MTFVPRLHRSYMKLMHKAVEESRTMFSLHNVAVTIDSLQPEVEKTAETYSLQLSAMLDAAARTMNMSSFYLFIRTRVLLQKF